MLTDESQDCTMIQQGFQQAASSNCRMVALEPETILVKSMDKQNRLNVFWSFISRHHDNINYAASYDQGMVWQH
jgi:hypothetical protein